LWFRAATEHSRHTRSGRKSRESGKEIIFFHEKNGWLTG
jgi:hypothetical protein